MDFYIALGGTAISICTLLRGADTAWGTRNNLEMLCDVSNNVCARLSCYYAILTLCLLIVSFSVQGHR